MIRSAASIYIVTNKPAELTYQSNFEGIRCALLYTQEDEDAVTAELAGLLELEEELQPAILPAVPATEPSRVEDSLPEVPSHTPKEKVEKVAVSAS